MVRQPEPPLVDSHFHIWHDGLPLMRAARHKTPTSATVEQLLALLDDPKAVEKLAELAGIFGTRRR